MNFWDSIKSSLYKYVEFTGRASRQEFWYWMLFLVILASVAMVIDYSINPTTYWDTDDWSASPSYLILIIFSALPGLSLNVRRLRDINKTWLWAVLFLFAEMFGLFFPVELILSVTDNYNVLMASYYLVYPLFILSLIIYLFSFYWLGFKKGN